jgi:Tol biopolymer transport system component/DNA-binding winged helix-turn-helix (wHTH) protein
LPVNEAASPGRTSGRIDLAAEPPFTLGSLKVLPATRGVESRHGRQIVEPRVMQALVCLAKAQGAVVSRDGLIASCWGGQVVGDDAINGCVAKVRQIAERHQPPPFVVETVPRVGYRLLALQATPPEQETSAAPSEPTPSRPAEGMPRRQPSRLVPVVLSAIVGAMIIAAAGYALWPGARWAVASSQPFIASLAVESSPAFSPDGTMVAYAAAVGDAPSKIFLRSVAGGEPIQLTYGNRFDDLPTWSSDGSHIAYASTTPGNRCHIMVIGVPAGAAREVSQCNREAPNGMSWAPHSNALYYSDGVPNGGGAIYRLDLDTGKKERVTRVAHEWELGGDARPSISPDGKWLAYIRAISGARKELHVVNLATGHDSMLDVDSRLRLTAWTEDSSTILASTTIWTGAEIQAFPRDGSAPYQIYTTPANIVDFTTGKNSLLAVTIDNSRINLAKGSATPSSMPDIVDPANGATGSPSFAPDGTLVFASNREGHYAIYTIAHGQKPVEIFSQGKDYMEIGGTKWSPDGRYISFVTFRKDAIVIRVITRQGQVVSTFDTSSVGAGFPTWTYDGKALVMYNKKTLQATRIEIADPTHRTSVAPPHWFSVTLRKDGVFAVRNDEAGLWRLVPDKRLVSASFPAGYEIRFYKNDILYPDFRSANPKILAQPLAGGPSRVFAYAPGGSANVDDDFAVDPKTGQVVYLVGVVVDSNIDLLHLAQKRL